MDMHSFTSHSWFCLVRISKLNVDSVVKGIGLGLLITFSFEFLSTMAGNMFAAQPYGLAWITGGFNLAGIGLSGAILGGWKKYYK